MSDPFYVWCGDTFCVNSVRIAPENKVGYYYYCHECFTDAVVWHLEHGDSDFDYADTNGGEMPW